MTNRIFISSMIIGGLLLTAIYTQAMSEPDLLSDSTDFTAEMALDTGQYGKRQGHRLAMMTTLLDLSADQQQQIAQLFSATGDAHTKAREEMRSTGEALNELKHAQPFDEAAFRNLAKQQADKRIDNMVERSKTRQQVFEILTPEQQEKAEELRGLMGKKGKGKNRKCS